MINRSKSVVGNSIMTTKKLYQGYKKNSVNNDNTNNMETSRTECGDWVGQMPLWRNTIKRELNGLSI